MQRSHMVAILAAAVLLAAAVVAGAWAWTITDDEGLSDRIVALAAVAQAASSVAIVVLTVALAWIGYAALSAARTEAAAAVDATAEARRSNASLREERELAVMPFLSASVSSSRQAGEFTLTISANNHSSHPALQVAVDLFHGPWDPSPPATLSNPPLRYTPTVREVIPAGDSKKFAWVIAPSDIGESVIVRLRYSGPLGGIVWQRYELRLHDRGERGDWFVQRERYIQPSVPGAAPIIII